MATAGTSTEVGPSRRDRVRAWMAADPDRARYAVTALAAGLVSFALFCWLQLDPLDGRVFANFYDIQARALLDGHLDVPAGALGNEAFAVRGQEFLYNPPGPSLLRLPVFLVTDRFDGRLTTLSMGAAHLTTVVLVSLLVWRLRRLLVPRAPLSRQESVLVGAFLITATAGSTVLYLAAVPWVFHEAYAWAIAMTIGSAHALLGLLARPSTAAAVATGAFTLGAVLSRATAGFACAAAVLAGAAWLWWRGADDRSWWWPVALAGAVPVVAGVAVNWAKFRHPWLFPIEDQVFTRVSAGRRASIEANGGDLFGVDLVRSTLPAYLRPDGIRFSSLFPFIALPSEPAPAYGGNVFDLTYRTGSVTSFMPVLVVLSVFGVTAVFRRGLGRAAAIVRFPVAGLALIPVGVLFGAYISHRYTAEFVPFLVVAGAVGVVDLGRRLGAWSPDGRRLAVGAVLVLAAYGVVANLAIAVSAQALANPGTVLADHLDRQERFSGLLGGDLDDHVVASVDLPASAPADQVRIIGGCQAVYVATGEEFTPWVAAGIRPLRWSVARSGSDPPSPEGHLDLARIAGHRRTTLALERGGEQLRLALRGGGHDDEGPWFTPDVGETFVVEVATDRTDDYVITIEGGDGTGTETELRVPKEDHDDDWYWQPNLLEAAAPTPQDLAAQGLLVTAEATDPPAGCPGRLARYREAELPQG